MRHDRVIYVGTGGWLSAAFDVLGQSYVGVPMLLPIDAPPVPEIPPLEAREPAPVVAPRNRKERRRWAAKHR